MRCLPNPDERQRGKEGGLRGLKRVLVELRWLVGALDDLRLRRWVWLLGDWKLADGGAPLLGGALRENVTTACYVYGCAERDIRVHHCEKV